MLRLLFPTHFFTAVLCAFIGFHSPAWANEPRIAVSKSPMSLPFFVAKEKNLFAEHKVDPILSICLGGNRCVKELAEGRVDMATASELPFMFAAFEGKPFGLISTFVISKNDMKFVTPKSIIKNGVNGLVGKRIGYVEKSASHYYMDLFLMYQGIDPQSTVHVPMGADKLADSLIKGEVDAISVWEPWGHTALTKGGTNLVAIETPKLYSQSFNLLANNDYRVSHLRKSIAVLAALDDAIKFIKKYPEEAKKIMMRNMELDAEIVSVTWPTYQFELSLRQSLLMTVEGQARWAIREGHVPKTQIEPNFLNFIDASLLRKVNPSSVDFVYP